MWCAFRVFIKASAGRNRINVLGAVNAIIKEVITMTNTTYITSTTLLDFLKIFAKSLGIPARPVKRAFASSTAIFS